MTDEKIVELFMENAQKVSATTVRVNSREELNRALSEMVEESASVYCPEITEIEKSLDVPPERRTEDYRTASVCVEEASGAIAETGSLVYTSHEGKPVQAGLLPAHHVAIVPARKIFETLDDCFASFKDAPPTNITLETGPSRTADIELTLTIGVHGPERLS
ncbi:MAG: lactate utilization protein, partial [Deltaproteobacteria bacterium]